MGVTSVVTVKGVVERQELDGVADPDTRFPIASVSKQMVAAAALLLAERGALSTDEPITRWYPGEKWQHITLHHLLTHTAGLGHWSEAPGFDVFAPRDPAERTALIVDTATPAAGSRWRYSGPGYLLAGDIIERAADQPYRDFLTEQFFVPLGMDSTTAGVLPDGAACGHLNGKPLPGNDFTMMPGAGDVWSTAADLARYTTGIQQGAVLSAESLARLIAAHTPVDGAPAPGTGSLLAESYGYGIYVGTVAGAPAVFHHGDNPGYSSITVWVPERAIGFAVLTNDEGTPRERLLRTLLDIM